MLRRAFFKSLPAQQRANQKTRLRTRLATPLLFVFALSFVSGASEAPRACPRLGKRPSGKAGRVSSAKLVHPGCPALVLRGCSPAPPFRRWGKARPPPFGCTRGRARGSVAPPPPIGVGFCRSPPGRATAGVARLPACRTARPVFFARYSWRVRAKKNLPLPFIFFKYSRVYSRIIYIML